MRCRRQALRGRPRGTLADDRPLALARRRQEAALTLCRGAQCRTSPNATAANSFATARCRKSSPTDAILCGEEFRTAKGRDHVVQARVDLAMIDDHWAIMELELVEPSLFFTFEECAATLLA